MSILRYTASADTTITNAFKSDLVLRATGSNMGAADSLEIFSIFAQADTGSIEKSRALLRFPTDAMATDRTSGDLPASGSVNFFLRLFNAKHPFTVPENITLVVHPITASWEEGYGLDMDGYTDLTYDGVGANWNNRSEDNTWTTAGGEFDTTKVYEVLLEKGVEDLETDITDLVEEWLDSSRANNGVGVMLTSSWEDGSAERSYYTKKFFARSSEYFYKRPLIEARWDSSRKDQRGNFYYSSSLASSADNLNTLYFYNFVRGQLANIPAVGDGNVYVDLFSGSAGVPSGDPLLQSLENGIVSPATGGLVIGSTGVYSCSVCLTAAVNDSPYTTLYDVWHGGDGGETYFTGTIKPISLKGKAHNPNPSYVTNITNLKGVYSPKETNTRFRLYTRSKDWCPTIYTKASKNIENNIIEDSFYRLYRISDDFDVIPYGTGSTNHTKLSYDISGSYFDLDMSMLEPGYAYGIKFLFYVNSSYREQTEVFKFRVE